MTEAQLLDAVWRRPDDDGPRLAYGDWLMQRGDPRGEFIRLQCAHGSGERERELEMLHGRAWLEPFTKLGVRVATFRRGFVDWVGAPPAVFEAHGAELLTLAPVSRVSIFGGDGVPATFLHSELFARIRSVDFSVAQRGDDFATHLAATPQAVGLAHLTISAGLTPRGAESLAASPHLAQLTHLSLPNNPLGGKGLAVIARSTTLRSLVELSFYGSQLDAETARAFAAAPSFRTLKVLNLGNNRIGDRGAAALARCTTLGSLQALDLERHAIHDKGAVAIAQSPHLTSLRTLNLAKNAIGDPGARAIATSPHLSRLLELNLADNLIEADGGIALAGSTTLTSLATLDLTQNQLRERGVDAFLPPTALPSLKTLKISANCVYTGTYTELSDWDGTVTGSAADVEGSPESQVRFAARVGLGLRVQ